LFEEVASNYSGSTFFRIAAGFAGVSMIERATPLTRGALRDDVRRERRGRDRDRGLFQAA
jgi:hypothetical protein